MDVKAELLGIDCLLVNDKNKRSVSSQASWPIKERRSPAAKKRKKEKKEKKERNATAYGEHDGRDSDVRTR